MIKKNRILYRFSISHYSEKVRWAIEYKGLRYERREVLPVIGQARLKRLSGSRQVPVFQDDNGQVVADSTAILKYLERNYPLPRLWPESPALKQRCDELEDWADEAIGRGVRAYVLAMARTDPRFGSGMRTAIRLLGPRAYASYGADYMGYASPEEAERRFPDVLAKLVEHLGSSSYLVGDAFSAADLTVCALLAPIYSPPNAALRYPWSSQRPPMAQDPSLKRVFEWMDFIFHDYRHASPGLNR